ncbi:MAG: ethanolamine ammonia-lyase subunit EutC [Gemmatimonadales bacterium]|nr:ethanolamine ammonia-lyase subunit EutC [Gemmatimonadales bacterium]
MSLTPADPWAPLRALTAARIALGRAGSSLPTQAHLAFQLAHAQARDAVHHVADLDAIAAALQAGGAAPVRVDSAAPDRGTYLLRPDLGRRLAEGAAGVLAAAAPPGGVDLAVVIADGLSGVAVERHAAPLVQLLSRALAGDGWTLAPPVLARQGRVALGDAIGAALGARLVLVLIGERPGLSAADSLGAYLTHDPRPGRTDADRNCVSNIRPDGLPVPAAARKLAWLLAEARRRRVTGVTLKDDSDATLLR